MNENTGIECYGSLNNCDCDACPKFKEYIEE